MRGSLVILFVLTLISTVSEADAVDKNGGQADLSSEAGQSFRAANNPHVIPKDERAAAAELYEKLLGHDAVQKSTESADAKISK